MSEMCPPVPAVNLLAFKRMIVSFFQMNHKWQEWRHNVTQRLVIINPLHSYTEFPQVGDVEYLYYKDSVPYVRRYPKY